MTVVRNEFEIGENDPRESLDKEIWAHGVPGAPLPSLDHRLAQRHRERADREAPRVLRHVLLARQRHGLGDRRLRRRPRRCGCVKKYYGGYPRAPQADPEDVYDGARTDRAAPRHRAARRRDRRGRPRASRSPDGAHADYPALNVLGLILSNGKTSRFYRALTDKNLTLDVAADTGFFHDPSLLQVYAYVAPGVTHEQVEKVAARGGRSDQERRRYRLRSCDRARQISRGHGLQPRRHVRDRRRISTKRSRLATGRSTTRSMTSRPRKSRAADVQARRQRSISIANKSTTGWFIHRVTAPAAAAP